MHLQQAINVIDRYILIPDELPSEDDYSLIEEAIARLRLALALRERSKCELTKLISVAQTVLNLAKLGGYQAIATALDEEMSISSWLDNLEEEEQCTCR